MTFGPDDQCRPTVSPVTRPFVTFFCSEPGPKPIPRAEGNAMSWPGARGSDDDGRAVAGTTAGPGRARQFEPGAFRGRGGGATGGDRRQPAARGTAPAGAGRVRGAVRQHVRRRAD